MTTGITRSLFFLSICLSVVGVAFLKFGVFPLNKQTHADVWPLVVSKLDSPANTFSLHESFSVIPKAEAAAGYDNSSAYIAIDMSTGNIIAQKNPTTPLPIASLTKVMSAVVSLDLANPQDELIISQNAALFPPTKIGVVSGQRMQVGELLHAMLMTSANDASEAMMDGINFNYGDNIFVRAMNEKARFLGLSSSHFANPQGFDNPQNKSSVHDLAILSFYAMSQYPLIKQIAGEEYLQLPANNLHKQFDLYNWNGLLGVYPGVTGLKIGNTTDAGYTTIVSAKRNGHNILVVLLGAPGVIERDLWASQLLDDAFKDEYGLSPVGITIDDLRAKYATWHYWN